MGKGLFNQEGGYEYVMVLGVVCLLFAFTGVPLLRRLRPVGPAASPNPSRGSPFPPDNSR